MRLRLLLPLLVLAAALPACDCGNANLQTAAEVCTFEPERCNDGGIDAGPVDAGPCPEGGKVVGKVCAPDQRTWVVGATVSVDTQDCKGQPLHLEAHSGAEGVFSLDGVPAGTQLVKAISGAFTREIPVEVQSKATTTLPDDQLCVAQRNVRIAVVTGIGDKIENLLTSLNLNFDLYDGTDSKYASEAMPFLADLTRMKQYDLIFIDCAAGKDGSNISLGSQKARIQTNLKDYVLQGGSLYASDWALLFAFYGAPRKLDFLTLNGQAIKDPQPTNQLGGFAPQTVTADVANADLAAYLGKNRIDIDFPRGSGVSSQHWGLMEDVDPGAEVLVSASRAKTCKDTSCAAAGSVDARNIPLAVQVKLTPATERGGRVVYTSFHNIAQSGDDVAKVLRYLVLHL